MSNCFSWVGRWRLIQAFSSVLVVRLEQKGFMTKEQMHECAVLLVRLEWDSDCKLVEKILEERKRAITALESVVKMLNDSSMQTMVSIEAIKVASKAIKENEE